MRIEQWRGRCFMPAQKVWHEEIQSWVFEDLADVDIPDDLDFDDLDLGHFDISQFDLSRATLPLHILEGKHLHKKRTCKCVI